MIAKQFLHLICIAHIKVMSNSVLERRACMLTYKLDYKLRCLLFTLEDQIILRAVETVPGHDVRLDVYQVL
jgi:hypothetical protein